MTEANSTLQRLQARPLVLGKTEGLVDFIYKSNTNDQADMYLRITEAIADHVVVEYSRDIRWLVNAARRKKLHRANASAG